MSRWARRGQCQGRAARSASEARQRQTSPVYQPVSSQWQERQCKKLRLPFVRKSNLDRPKPPPPLRGKEPCVVHETGGDGNCLFRCLSLVITGSESHHNIVRQRIVSHISQNCNAFSALLPESPGNGSGNMDACARYLSTSKMANGATWGSDVEILAAAHLLRTRIFVFTLHGSTWQWVEHGLELTEPSRRPHRESIFLMHTGLVHYDLVEAVRHCVDELEELAPSAPIRVNQQRMRKVRNAGARRCRGYSVPCQRPGADCSSRYSRSSSSSSAYSSANSDSCCSCVESVGSSISSTSISVVCDRRKSSKPGAMTTEPRGRSKIHPARSFTCNNNNCFTKKPKKRALKKTPQKSTQWKPRRNKNRYCHKKLAPPLHKGARERVKKIKVRKLRKSKSLNQMCRSLRQSLPKLKASLNAPSYLLAKRRTVFKKSKPKYTCLRRRRVRKPKEAIKPQHCHVGKGSGKTRKATKNQQCPVIKELGNSQIGLVFRSHQCLLGKRFGKPPIKSQQGLGGNRKHSSRSSSIRSYSLKCQGY